MKILNTFLFQALFNIKAAGLSARMPVRAVVIHDS